MDHSQKYEKEKKGKLFIFDFQSQESLRILLKNFYWFVGVEILCKNILIIISNHK